MGRKNLLDFNEELNQLIAQYEKAKAENRQLYLDADQLADIADRYATERRYKEAQEAIDYGLILHPENQRLLIEQAYLFLDINKVTSAKEVVERITDTSDVDSIMLKAEILLHEGLVDEAEETLAPLEMEDDVDFIVDIAYLYIEMGYPEYAKKWLDKGAEQYKDEEEYISVAADYFSATNQREAAELYYNRLIDIEPYDPVYWMGLAKCRFADNDCEKAIEACDFALAADDKYGEAYIYRAHCYFYLNNSDAAIADYKQALECKALPPEMAYMLIALAFSNKEEWEDAYNYYKLVYSIYEEKNDVKSPLLIDAFINWATAASCLGNQEEAHQLCERAKAINPEEATIYLAEGRVYLDENLYIAADECFQKAVMYDSSIETWYLVGCTFADSPFLEYAPKYFEKVYELDPNYSDVIYKLTILSLTNNEVDNFFKYNNQSTKPVTEEAIEDILKKCDTKEAKKALKEILKRMKQEKKK